MLRNIRLDIGSKNTWSASDEGETGHMFRCGDGSSDLISLYKGSEDRNNSSFIVLSLLLEDIWDLSLFIVLRQTPGLSLTTEIMIIEHGTRMRASYEHEHIMLF